MTTNVTLIFPVSKNTELSDMLRPTCGDHSPTLTIECCFNLTNSNLNCIRRPSFSSIGPEIPFHSTYL